MRKQPSGARSIMSTSSTIPPEEIKRRVALEAFRKKEKVRSITTPNFAPNVFQVKLKVKGKQSAVRRGRKENHNVISEYAGWI